MIQIRVSKQLQFHSGNHPLLVDVLLQENNITALYGESGAGKTTLLKIMAGIVTPEEGFIQVNDVVWLDTKRGINLPPQKRSIGFVFQDYALFPNMTVLQNLHYAAGKKKDDAFIRQLVETVSLQPFLHTKPLRLSGGQQQRVALVRALVRKPQLLLLDEPLAALNTTLRYSLHEALRVLQQQLSFTALLVSHDVGEVYQLAHHVVQLREGNVVCNDTPQHLFGTGSSGNQIQITGEVVSVIQKDENCFVEVLAGTSVIQLTPAKSEMDSLQIGDKVLLNADASHVRIVKMK